MAMDIKNHSTKEILKNAPNGANLFRFPSAKKINYYQLLNRKILYWSKDGFWIKTDLTIQKLADLGGMPLHYDINWREYLSEPI